MKISLFVLIIIVNLLDLSFCESNSSTESDEEDRQLELEYKHINGNSSQFTRVRAAVKKIIKKIKIYYGDNDKPVTDKLASISSYLTRFGYVDYVKRIIKSNISNIKTRFIGRMKHTNFGQQIIDPHLYLNHIKSMGQVIINAIRMFQRFMRLTVTGSVDSLTLMRMNEPRCGGKDMGEQRVSPNYITLKSLRKAVRKKLGLRQKRHTLAGSRWKIRNITYKITRYPTSYQDKRSVIDDQITKAFKYWSDVTPLIFTKLSSMTPSRNVIIDIRFEKGEHGDGDPHDGAGKVLAHAYFPQYGGDAHFDDDEIWTVDSSEGSNILMTAIHELGHCLGLDHSDAPNSIMNPIYPPYKPNLELSQDDIRAIQLLYGSKSGVLEVPNLCTDANLHFWRVKSDEMRLDSDYPKLISEGFPPIKGKIDDAIQMPDSSVYIFQGEKCYKFNKDFKIVDGFPKNIKDLFPSIPTHIDAAIHLNGVIYAFKGAMFWKYDLKRKTKQKEDPKPIESKWPGIPNYITAVFGMSDALYFFKGQQFYRLNELKNKYKQSDSSPPYPRKTALWWFGCY